MPERVIVETKVGKLRGKRSYSSFSNKTYYSFVGIPYAKPPVGDLRFKPPVKKSPWKSIKNATIEGEDCIQYSFYRQKVIGSEDCLYLNIHVPERPSNIAEPKAVIVQVHSGGHLWGSGSSEIHGNPDYLIHQDIIYVTVNYRLHVLGFLNLKLPDCPGNVGIKDIIMALQWVQENIEYFGGNPKQVTLCGQCTGASLIHFLMMSPLAKGLYHNVIMMGDYVFNPLANYRDNPLEIAFEFGKLLGFHGESAAELLQFLKNQNLTSMIGKMPVMLQFIEKKYGRMLPTAPFMPSVEVIEEGAVIPRSPVELMNEIEPVPIIFGVCENEAVFGFVETTKLTTSRQYQKIFRENCWGWMHSLDFNTLTDVIKKIKKYYFGEEDLNNKNTTIQMYDDAMLTDFYDTVADVIWKKLPSTPVYIYKFSYLGGLNGMRALINLCANDEIKGTIHADDYFYMVRCPLIYQQDRPVEEDCKVIEKFTRLITNFAKTGNPNDNYTNVTWKQSTAKNPCHLIVGKTLEIRESVLNEERFYFWKKIKKIYSK